MSLYPSLEDMKVDQMMKAQFYTESVYTPQVPQEMPALPTAPAYDQSTSTTSLYPSLGDYMGLELSEEMIEQNMPEYALVNRQNLSIAMTVPQSGSLGNMIAPISGDSIGLKAAFVTNGIRQLVLCKDKNGKVGIRVHAVNNGIFVALVSQNTPAALAGLRFGDQLLEINGEVLAGYSMQRVHEILRKAPVNGINVVVRDRPFERTVTMHKDSTGHIGFQFKNGKIIALGKSSSAARNGLLTEHQILEVNGKNVVGLKDKDITAEIENGGDVITITVIPSYIYDHMIKNMAGSLVKSLMDHSAPIM